jgi:hypothetical protein
MGSSTMLSLPRGWEAGRAASRAKPLECVRLAGAFGRLDARQSGSKLPHSKRFALACAILRKPNIAEAVAVAIR